MPSQIGSRLSMSKMAPSLIGLAVGSALALIGTVILPPDSNALPTPPTDAASVYKSLKLFDEVFDIVRANYIVRPDEA